MVRVKEADGILIEEYRLGFLERHFMLSLILPIFMTVPLELNVIHMYTVRICMI